MRKKDSFTLIELLVVVAIIATLISILMPSLKKAREQVKMVVCASNLRGVGVGAMVYAGEWGMTLPLACSWGQASTNFSDSWGHPNGASALALNGYANVKGLYSPDDTRKYSNYRDNWSGKSGWVGYSYVLREPQDNDHTFPRPPWGPKPSVQFPFGGCTHIEPSYGGCGGWRYYFNLGRYPVRALAADRFTQNFVFSFHGGDESLASGANYGNGKGWHVAFTDGHVNWFENDPNVYAFNGLENVGGWTNRDAAWGYWDWKD